MLNRRAKILCLISAAILFFNFYSYSQSKSLDEHDGTDWISDNVYVKAQNLGLIGGIIMGTSIIQREIQSRLDRLSENKGIKDIDKLPIKRINDSVQNLCLYDITVGQIKDGIDTLYNDFSNRRIKVIDAVYVVKMQIEGKDPDLIQAQLRYLRMQPLNTKAYGEALDKIMAAQDYKLKNGDFNIYFTNDDLKKGVVTEQDLLFYAVFVDKNNINHDLFCYGSYK